MSQPQDPEIEKILDIVAEEACFPRAEIDRNTKFTNLGIDDILAKSILSHISAKTGLHLPSTTFKDHPTVHTLQSYLSHSSTPSPKPPYPPQSTPNPPHPLSTLLQNAPTSPSTRTLFLLPDGSGSATSYLRLPPIHPQICLIALSSPYLHAGAHCVFSIESLARIFATEIQIRQPHGPYMLGGWSAGGYYAYEVCKVLLGRGECVSRVVLIDSPCRVVYGALDMGVVEWLCGRGVMGGWAGKGAPGWLLDHFRVSVRAIARYVPTAVEMEGGEGVEVFVVWARDGVLRGEDGEGEGLDFRDGVTELLLRRSVCEGAMGWEGLFPGRRIRVATMKGNHFSMVHPPECEMLSALLRDVVQDRDGDRKCVWNVV